MYPKIRIASPLGIIFKNTFPCKDKYMIIKFLLEQNKNDSKHPTPSINQWQMLNTSEGLKLEPCIESYFKFKQKQQHNIFGELRR